MKEEWRTIEEYPDYEISSFGRVKSLKFGKEKILKQAINKGYFYVGLHKDNKRKNYFVHRLVATAFIPNPDNLPIINHKDENPSNNHLSNLEWCTIVYNINYGLHNERVSKAKKGIKQSKELIEKRVKITQKPILQLSKSGNIILGKFNSVKQAGNELNINRGNISNCLKGKLKSAGKYRWMYYDDYTNRMNKYFDLALKKVS